jgi:curved DNA binding protein
MTNRVLQKVQAAAVAGAKTIDLCILGDAEIVAETGAVYNKKNAAGEYVKKGIAFPTCVSVNNCVCHNSPLPEDDEIILKDGDLVKIDLAIHLDGYIAPLATSFTVGGPATGRVADALLAAHKAAEVALRMLRPGTKSYAITDAITKVADAFNCKPIEGMLSHTLSQNKIDGEKAIIQAPTPALRKEHKEFVVEENEVYAVDIVMSTGAGKIKEGAQRTTVFKKTDLTYGLKMKSSKSLYYEVNKNFGGMPFCTRACSDIKTAKVGVIECVKHGTLCPLAIALFRMHPAKPGAAYALFPG